MGHGGRFSLQSLKHEKVVRRGISGSGQKMSAIALSLIISEERYKTLFISSYFSEFRGEG